MSLSEDLLSDLYEVECTKCKNIWWVPNFGEELSMPRYCCFCRTEFDGFVLEEDE